MDTQICLEHGQSYWAPCWEMGIRSVYTEQKEGGKGSEVLRFPPSWRANHDNGNAAGVKQSPRHGTVELGRRHVLILSHIMDAIDEG